MGNPLNPIGPTILNKPPPKPKSKAAKAGQLKPAPDAVSRSAGVMMLYDPVSGKYEPALTANGGTIKYKAAGSVRGSGASTASVRVAGNAYATASKQAAGYALQLKGKSVAVKIAGVSTGQYKPRYSRAEVRAMVWTKYHTQFINALNQLIKTGQKPSMSKDQFRNTWEAWITQLVNQAYQ